MLVKKHKVAVLISGNGSNLQALIDAAAAPDYPAEISLVISNKPEAYGLVRASNARIPAHIIEHKNYSGREEFDESIHQLLQKYAIEFVCLAGFMRILSANFVNKWQGKMINIHPSLLPDFKGGNAVSDALNAGVLETGCTVHMVTEEMDAGEIIAQKKVAVYPGDTKETLHQRIHEQEHILYPQALNILINNC